jgi:uncharacterized protein (DUF2062 family)
MPRRLLRRYLPDQGCVSDHWLFKHASAHLMHPKLWRLDRRSVARATGVGLCVAFLPIPQLVTIVGLAIWLRINLPVALAMVLVTNPLTLVPAFYMNYLVGAWLLRTPPWQAPAELTLGLLIDQLDTIWLPLYTGSLVVGAGLGLVGMLLVDYAWQRHVRHQRRKKRHLR